MKALINHAKKYGVEGVAETAADIGYTVDELAALIEKLDGIEAAHLTKKYRFATVKKHRLTYEDRAKRLLGIEDEE